MTYYCITLTHITSWNCCHQVTVVTEVNEEQPKRAPPKVWNFMDSFSMLILASFASTYTLILWRKLWESQTHLFLSIFDVQWLPWCEWVQCHLIFLNLSNLIMLLPHLSALCESSCRASESAQQTMCLGVSSFNRTCGKSALNYRKTSKIFKSLRGILGIARWCTICHGEHWQWKIFK